MTDRNNVVDKIPRHSANDGDVTRWRHIRTSQRRPRNGTRLRPHSAYHFIQPITSPWFRLLSSSWTSAEHRKYLRQGGRGITIFTHGNTYSESKITYRAVQFDKILHPGTRTQDVKSLRGYDLHLKVYVLSLNILFEKRGLLLRTKSALF